jgi:hypothetical protein
VFRTGHTALPTRRTDARARAVPLALGALVAFGAVLRVWRLGSPPLNFDESFTAMVGRLPLGAGFSFLRAHDSHPPLDYLLQLPLARAGVNPWMFRLPAALCSIGALGLFAWWMRGRGRVGLVATAAMSLSAFQLRYAREARMYAVLQLIGVAVAIVTEAWMRAPRRRHAVLISVVVFLGLMTHVSMILAAIGLLAIAGRRRDADAWRWRAGIALAATGWAVLWGPSFLVQSRGGHSSWIPHTTIMGLVDTVGSLVIARPGVSVLVVATVIAGLVVCHHRDATLAKVMLGGFVVPVVLAAVIGLRAPVLLDRTLTVFAWGPLVAVGYAADAIWRRARAAGAVAVAVAVFAMAPAAASTVTTTGGPSAALHQLERVARQGDVVAIQPLSKGVELDWTLGIRSDDGTARSVQFAGAGHAVALELTGRPPTGRIWLMQYRGAPVGLGHFRRCARTWHHGPTRLLCIVRASIPRLVVGSSPSILTIYDRAPVSSGTTIIRRSPRSAGSPGSTNARPTAIPPMRTR